MSSIKLAVAVERLCLEAPTVQTRLIGARRGHLAPKFAINLKKKAGVLRHSHKAALTRLP